MVEQHNKIADVFLVLDSTTYRLCRVDRTLGTRLESEGRELYWMVAKHVLTCFQIHDPSISLVSVIEALVAEVVDEAQASI